MKEFDLNEAIDGKPFAPKNGSFAVILWGESEDFEAFGASTLIVVGQDKQGGEHVYAYSLDGVSIGKDRGMDLVMTENKEEAK